MRHWIKKVYTRAEIRKLYLLYVNQEYVEIKRQVDATEVFYCRSYCLFNMFPAPLCPSSGTQRVLFSGCCLWYFVLWISSFWSGLVWSWGLCVRFAGCCFTAVKQHPAKGANKPQLHNRPATWKPQHEIPHAATTVQYSWAPDDGHSGARNMLSKK